VADLRWVRGGGEGARLGGSVTCPPQGRGSTSGAPMLSLPTTWAVWFLFVRYSFFGLLPPCHYAWQGVIKNLPLESGTVNKNQTQGKGGGRCNPQHIFYLLFSLQTWSKT
jgi:hypothetical protein